ncbi:MAG: hypothetical protein R2710_04235 [Acidimicrobiales bacterium]
MIAHAAREYTDTDTIGQVITILEVADRGDEAARLLQTVIERHRRDRSAVLDELSSRLRALVPQRPIAAHQRAAASVALRHPALDLAGTSPLIGQHDIVDTPDVVDIAFVARAERLRQDQADRDGRRPTALSGQPCLYVIPLADDAPPLAAPTLPFLPSHRFRRPANPAMTRWPRPSANIGSNWSVSPAMPTTCPCGLMTLTIDAASLDVVRLLTALIAHRRPTLGHGGGRRRRSVVRMAELAPRPRAPLWSPVLHIAPLERDDIIAAVLREFGDATLDARG